MQPARKRVKKDVLKSKPKEVARPLRGSHVTHLKAMGKQEMLDLIREAKAVVSDKELEEGVQINSEVSPTARDTSQAEEKFGGGQENKKEAGLVLNFPCCSGAGPKWSK